MSERPGNRVIVEKFNDLLDFFELGRQLLPIKCQPLYWRQVSFKIKKAIDQ
tara:strand:+ start:729 stop:881 length:153 start_codon:yes stop_codon:yes gene_type:complete